MYINDYPSQILQSLNTILIKNITRLELPTPTSIPDIYLIDKNFNTKRISEIELKSLNIASMLVENNPASQSVNLN